MADDPRLELRYFIDELKSRVDIVQALGPYVKLERQGKSHKGLCPFHSENTASFQVLPDRGYYHCFGCGAHGDVIKFLQHFKHGGDFMATLKALAADHGMRIPSRGGEKRDMFKAQHELLERASDFFRKQLAKSKEAQEYLAERGLSEKLAQQFEIGYAPNEWSSMTALVKDENERRIMLDLGLLKLNEDRSRVYDAFRGRIMFPIRNEFGKLVGFGGRTVIGDDAKYINSQQSRVFDKGRLLYGLHQAIPSAKEQGMLVLVEGYTDVISLSAARVGFAAAPMGTALTERQAEIALRYPNKIVFCFDADDAGRRAAEKALRTILGVLKDGKGASFLFLPAGEDPDTYIRKHGKAAFMELVDGAHPLSDFLVETLGKSYSENSDEIGKVSFLTEVTEHIEQVKPEKAPFLRETLYEAVARRAGMTSAGLKTAARQARNARVEKERRHRSGSLSIVKDGILYRLLDCLNSKPELAYEVADLPLLGEPQEVAYFHEAYQWLLDQENPKINLLASYIEETGQIELARQLRKSTLQHVNEIDAVETFKGIACKLKELSERKSRRKKFKDTLREAMEDSEQA